VKVGSPLSGAGAGPAIPEPSVEGLVTLVPAAHQTTTQNGSRPGKALVLNATMEPLCVVPARRAVVLVLAAKADVIETNGHRFRSAELDLAAPSVVRLRSYVRVPYRARIPMTRAALMHRDRFRCAYCGAKADTVDHVVPRSRGGDHSWENCVAACSTCNHRKADHLLTELGWTLRSVPVPPKGQHWRLLSSVKELDPAWVRYLGEGAA
jgi:5-methylcytosine-specific restriction endonuclease McrA